MQQLWSPVARERDRNPTSLSLSISQRPLTFDELRRKISHTSSQFTPDQNGDCHPRCDQATLSTYGRMYVISISGFFNSEFIWIYDYLKISFVFFFNLCLLNFGAVEEPLKRTFQVKGMNSYYFFRSVRFEFQISLYCGIFDFCVILCQIIDLVEA